MSNIIERVMVSEFQIEYTNINSELKKNEKMFDISNIGIYIAKINDGFIVKRINKTTKKGTKVTYKTPKDKKEFTRYIEKVANIIIEYEEKYSAYLGVNLNDIGEV